jgi:hypothetical protein
MGVDHLEKRLARLAPKPAPAPAAPAAPPKVEFVVVPPATQRRTGGSRTIAVVILIVMVAFAAKGLVLAQMGAQGLHDMRQNLAAGSLWQRGLAVVLHPDPVTLLLAEQFGLPAAESGETVRLLHESGVTMIETEHDAEGATQD